MYKYNKFILSLFAMILLTSFHSHAEDPFSILGVSKQATFQDVKNAYIAEAIIAHPDRESLYPNSHQNFNNIANAYQSLAMIAPTLDAPRAIRYFNEELYNFLLLDAQFDLLGFLHNAMTGVYSNQGYMKSRQFGAALPADLLNTPEFGLALAVSSTQLFYSTFYDKKLYPLFEARSQKAVPFAFAHRVEKFSGISDQLKLQIWLLQFAYADPETNWLCNEFAEVLVRFRSTILGMGFNFHHLVSKISRRQKPVQLYLRTLSVPTDDFMPNYKLFQLLTELMQQDPSLTSLEILAYFQLSNELHTSNREEGVQLQTSAREATLKALKAHPYFYEPYFEMLLKWQKDYDESTDQLRRSNPKINPLMADFLDQYYYRPAKLAEDLQTELRKRLTPCQLVFVTLH